MGRPCISCHSRHHRKSLVDFQTSPVLDKQLQPIGCAPPCHPTTKGSLPTQAQWQSFWQKPLRLTEQVRSVLSLQDPYVRLKAIVDAYHHLGSELSMIIGKKDATIPYFAQWGTALAARTFCVGEVTGFWVSLLCSTTCLSGLPTFLLQTYIDTFQFQLTKIATLIFSHMGMELALFSDTFRDPVNRTEEKLNQFLKQVSEPGGKVAFDAYFRAIHTTDSRLKAQLIYFGNCKLIEYEQLIAQPHLNEIFPLDVVAEIASRFFLTLAIGNTNAVNLPFYHDILTPLSDIYPSDLRIIAIPELQLFLQKFDRDADGTAKSGAQNWNSYHERMGFIVEIFRIYAQHPAVFEDATQRLPNIREFMFIPEDIP